MKVSFKQEGLDVNKNIYECSICGNLFNWNKESMWYGSDWQVENKPERIKYFCSEECATIWRNTKKQANENKKRNT